MINQMDKDRSSSAAVAYTDEFEDEDAKMERFYELIRSFNEARANHQRNLQQFRSQNHDEDQVINLCNGNDNQNNKKKDLSYKGTKSLDSCANFLPSFKREDFIRDACNNNNNNNHHHEDRDQVVVWDKSGTDFLKNPSNFSEIGNRNVINECIKKRKINEVYDDDDGDEDDGIINNADKVKISRPQIELDLNLAL